VKCVLLLRGVNVGGHNKLPMKDLKVLLKDTRATDIATVIQSGNVVLESELSADPLASRTQLAIKEKLGFSPQIMVLPADDYLVNANPFPEAVAEPKMLHAFFAIQCIELNQDALSQYQAESESVQLAEEILWLDAPAAIGHSNLVDRIAQITQTDTTARNWNTPVN
jgi:uncharacterized protein (DUF1697 family)